MNYLHNKFISNSIQLSQRPPAGGFFNGITGATTNGGFDNAN